MDGRPWEILLVDDDPDFLFAAKRMLARSNRINAHVQTAVEPAEALRLVDESLVDVVVADFRMPPGDGAQLLRQVHDANPDLKRVLLTGYDSAALQENGVDTQGIDLVLDKNDLLEGLDRKLREFLERGR